MKWFDTQNEAISGCRIDATAIGFRGELYCGTSAAWDDQKKLPYIAAGWLCNKGPNNCPGFEKDPTSKALSFTFYFGVVCPNGEELDPDTGICTTSRKNVSDTCSANAFGNPVLAHIGYKQEITQDYSDAAGILNLTRYYNSLQTGKLNGPGWQHSFARSLVLGANNKVRLIRPSGRVTQFIQTTAGTWQAEDPDINEQLQNLGTNWQWTQLERNETETYDASGKILNWHNASGQTLTFTYTDGSNGTTSGQGGYILNADGSPSNLALPAGLLLRVQDAFGRQIQFGYDSKNQPILILLPGNLNLRYQYDALGNLTQVTYPDGKTRTYLYNEAAYTSATNLPYALTGIVDENGTRYAYFTYQADGKAIETSYSAGVNRYRFDYSVAGRTSVTDPQGQTTQLSFNKILGVQKLVNSNQPCSNGCGVSNANISYDSNGNISSRQDFNGVSTTYTYDLTRNLETQRIEALGQPEQRTISTAWHPRLSLPTKIAQPKKLTGYLYNGDTINGSAITCAPNLQATVLCQQIEQATDDVNGAQGLTPTLSANLPARITSYTYNANGQVLTVDGPQTGSADTTTYTYYASSDPNGNWMQGDRQSIRNALGQITQFTRYNAHGQPLEMIDANGLITRYTYDVRQRLLSRSVGSSTELAASTGLTTQYQYDAVGQLTQLTAANGSRLNYIYDAAHRLTQIADTLGNKLSFTLDGMGNRIQEQLQDPNGSLMQTQRREYDALNRLAKDLGAQNQTTQYQYDANGNLTQITDPLNRISTQQYDRLNRLIAQLAPALTSGPDNGKQATTRYTYDGQDQLTQIQDPRTLATHYTRTGLGQTTQQQSPDSGNTTYTYDAAGNRLTQTDAKGQTTRYTYDVLNRLTSIQYADNSTINYTYDGFNNTSTTAFNYGKGRLTTLTEKNPAGTLLRSIAYRYDLYGRLVQEQRLLAGKTYTTGYTYGTPASTTAQPGAVGQLTAITYPSGRIVLYAYDALGRINQVSTQATRTAALQTLASNIQYQARNRNGLAANLKSLTYGNGQTLMRSFDQDGRLSSYTLGGTTTGTNPAFYQLTWDNANRISAIDQMLPTAQLGQAIASYGYDELDRLTQVTPRLATNARSTYQYDLNGNRSQRQQISTGSSSTQTSLIAATSNRLQSLDGIAQTYDANGNLTADKLVSRTYDARNRLIQAVTAQQTLSFEINALGQRVRKRGSNLTLSPDTVYHYDSQGRLLAESPAPSGSTIPRPTKEYIWLGDLPLVVYAGTTPYYIHSDHLNTPRLISDAQGQTRWYWLNDEAFGANAPNEQPTAGLAKVEFNLRFSGQYWDKETATSYNYFRDYNPQVGRYTTSDPIGLQGGINTYTYVENDPLRKIDPLGLEAVLPGPGGVPIPIYIPTPSNATINPPPGGWPDGFDWPPKPKPPLSCRIEIPSIPFKPPPKPSCETAFSIRKAMCSTAPGVLSKATCLMMAIVEYGICKKMFGGNDN